MRKISSIILPLLFIGYLAFSMITLSDLERDSSDPYHKKVMAEKFELNSPEQFDCAKINEILNHTVVMDSTLMQVITRDDGVYLKTEVINSCDKKIIALLKCSSEDLKNLRHHKINRGFLTANIFKIEELNPVAQSDSLDGKTVFITTEKITILTGEFLSFVEKKIS
jgi:hypothetical protein